MNVPQGKFIKMASKDSLGSFDTVAADALITEFRRRMLMFKTQYKEMQFLRLKTIIEDEFDLEFCSDYLKQILERVIRVNNFTYVSKQGDDVYSKTTLNGVIFDDSGLQRDFDFLCKQLEFQKIYNMKNYKSKLTSLSGATKLSAFNFVMKIERVNLEGNFPSIVIMHLDSKCADAVFNDHGLSPNLVNLLIKYSDLSLNHDDCTQIENFQSFLDLLEDFMQEIITNLEYLMLPKLIQVISEVTNMECIFVNDADNHADQYKHVEKAIFLGYANDYSKMPVILNADVNDDLKMINSLVNQAWIKVKNWIVKEKSALESNLMLTDMVGNYVLNFNSRFELNFMNGLDREALGIFFKFPHILESVEQVNLSNIVKHGLLKDNLVNVIEEMIKSHVRIYEISKPQMTIKISYNIKGMFKGFSIIIRDSVLRDSKATGNFYSMFEYIVNNKISKSTSSHRSQMIKGNKQSKTNKDQDLSSNSGEGSRLEKENITTKKVGLSKFYTQQKKRPSIFKTLEKDAIGVESKRIFEESRSRNDANTEFEDLESEAGEVMHKNPQAKPSIFIRPPRKMNQMKSGQFNINNDVFSKLKSKRKLSDDDDDDNMSVGGFSMANKIMPNTRAKASSIMSLAVPGTQKQKINHQLNLLKTGERERRSSYAFFEKDIMNSKIREFMQMDMNESDNMSMMGNDNEGSQRDIRGMTFVGASNKNLILPVRHGNYDNSDADGKEVLEALNKKKSKVEQRIAFEKRIPEPSQIFNHPNIENMVEWNLNTLDMSELQLIVVIRDIFTNMEIFKNYQIKMQVFTDFMWSVAYYYQRNTNPFHNFYHGVTVSHSCFMFMQKSEKLNKLLSEDEQFAFVVSGLGHDLDHRGKNNTFEINSSSDLAIRYHDSSPLEQHHAAILFKILINHKTNLMNKVSADKSKDLRKMMIENIKNTDMSVHFKLMAEFKERFEADENFGISEDPEIFKKDKILITNLYLHTADLSGSTKCIEIASRWSNLVNEEFSCQYSEEQRLGIPVTPYFANLDDRKTFCKSELGFLKFIVTPLFVLADDWAANQINDIVETVKDNMDYYERNLQIEIDKEEKLNNIQSRETPINEDEESSHHQAYFAQKLIQQTCASLTCLKNFTLSTQLKSMVSHITDLRLILLPSSVQLHEPYKKFLTHNYRIKLEK